MLPEKFFDLAEQPQNENNAALADKTYDLNGFTRLIDGINAVKQAVMKILNTERFRYPVYSADYGVELESLFGRDCDYVCAELERRIAEALTADERITAVDEFAFVVRRGVVFASFIVHTVYGDFESFKEVEL
jgi:hypothetical protein